MKFALLATISGLICYIGFKMSSSYWQKQMFYDNFCKFLIFLKGEIGFLKSDLIQILSNYQSSDKNLKTLFKNYIEFLKSGSYQSIQILTDEENIELQNFIHTISKSDCYLIDGVIEKYQEIFAKKLEECKLSYQKSGVLYKKLSIILAIFICIVLI